jgi:Aspartyl/Asparaginyl beta-hydroxylase
MSAEKLPEIKAVPPMDLPDRVKLNLAFDAKRLQQDLEGFQPGDWIDHFVKSNYEGQWSVIPLRGPATATHPVMMIYSDPTCTEFADTPYLEKSEHFRTVLKSFACPILAVRIMKLAAGSRIKEHTDHDLAAELGTARLHIPVVTNDGVDFKLNGTKVVLAEGDCWYLRLSDPHSVENNGETDRVHLVVDVRVNPWLREMLELGP